MFLSVSNYPSIDVVAAAAALLLFLLLNTAPTVATDITVSNFWCDEKLPVYATDFKMQCDEGGCSLGSDAIFTAILEYSSVTSSKALLTVDVSQLLLSTEMLKHTLFKEKSVDLCNDEEIAPYSNNANLDCPEDGTYVLYAKHTLPTSGNNDWFLSGWKINANTYLYNAYDSSILMGHCTVTVSSSVTNTKATLIHPPSASASLGLALGFIMLFIVGGMMIYGMHRRTATQKPEPETTYDKMDDPRPPPKQGLVYHGMEEKNKENKSRPVNGSTDGKGGLVYHGMLV